MPNSIGGYHCAPHKFSSDSWDKESVAGLKHLLRRQKGPDNAAAVLVGSGGLPYLFGLPLRSSVVCLVDLNREVLETTKARVEMLQEHDNWQSYHWAVAGRFCRLGSTNEMNYLEEQATARSSGLQGDYERTRAKAAATELRLYQGDMRQVIPAIGRILLAEDRHCNLANVTNVLSYWELAEARTMPQLLDRLRLSSDAVIIDSSTVNLTPISFTVADYAEAAATWGT